jgi:hypothetical protein
MRLRKRNRNIVPAGELRKQVCASKGAGGEGGLPNNWSEAGPLHQTALRLLFFGVRRLCELRFHTHDSLQMMPKYEVANSNTHRQIRAFVYIYLSGSNLRS